MARLDDLREMRVGLIKRRASCKSDQTYAVLVRTQMDVIEQIDAIVPESVARKETPLDEFTKRLLDRRRAGAPGQDRPVADGDLG